MRRLTAPHVDIESNITKSTMVVKPAHSIEIAELHRSWWLSCDCHLVMVCCVVSSSVWSVCSPAAPTVEQGFKLI
jgi:hypothetical protein